MIIAKFVAVVVIAYLLGSIPFGLIISKLRSGIDVRKYGSGKTGATNVMRTVGTKLGFLTIFLDGFKAGLAVQLARVIINNSILPIGSIPLDWQVAQVIAGIVALVGHNWPLFAKFKGGRGVAAYFGTLLVISPPAAIFGIEVLAISALLSKHMSLGSMLGALAAWCLLLTLTIINNSPAVYLIYGSIVTGLLVYLHRDNVKRLKQGTERKLW